MGESGIVTQVVLDSPVLEELNAAFEAICALEASFLQPSDHDFRPYHAQLKHLANHLQQYYPSEPSVKELEEEMAAHQGPFFAPCRLLSFHNSDFLDPTTFPPARPTFRRPPAINYKDPGVDKRRQYPLMTSVPFSLVDEQLSLQQLVGLARTQPEIGLTTICHPHPLTLCAISLSLRECEYLIDVAEVPTAVDDLAPLLSDANVIKVVPNAAQTCRDLHYFGASGFLNVFCVATASFFLGSPGSLEQLTVSCRRRLQEGWRAAAPIQVRIACPSQTRSAAVLSQVIALSEATALHDWRLRPLSLDQMNIARQDVHYLLYLYDSLRCYVNRSTVDSALRSVYRISHQRAAVDWSRYRSVLVGPNALILSSLYRQPVPNLGLFQKLMRIKVQHGHDLTDASILWLALAAPQTESDLEKQLSKCGRQQSLNFRSPAIKLSEQLQTVVLAATREVPSPTEPDADDDQPKTMDELVVELGWVCQDQGEVEPEGAEGSVATGISPRLMSPGRMSPGANLKHLMNPDQPTSVSRQIEGIPTTEPAIYALANDVRMRQKLQGKTKAKLPSGQDEVPPDDDTETLLHNLVAVGYIDDQEARKIKEKCSAAKPAGQRRSRSAEKNNQRTMKTPPSGQSSAFGRDRRRPPT
jgi:ribonuclease D